MAELIKHTGEIERLSLEKPLDYESIMEILHCDCYSTIIINRTQEIWFIDSYAGVKKLPKNMIASERLWQAISFQEEPIFGDVLKCSLDEIGG